ncbi:MAG: S-adenosylmethionine decarboxylase proenzyme [Candidatus Moranbacteria bacterium]|nr:S-adenosylmethionine decarboxylase proenzyme [Candidatus Moranbacteria bacterium]
MKTGLHLIGDLHGCQFSPSLRDERGVEELKSLISQKIKDVDLRELGSYYHYFGPDAVTAVVCLSESHISFHSWAKEKYTSLDVFVCNYKTDNTKKAKELFEYLIAEVFRPKKVKKQEIER